MDKLIEAETEHLYLRQWKQSDREPFAKINADPQVMEFFPSILTRVESDALADCFQLEMEKQGWGLWAVESKATKKFIGFVGLKNLSDDFPFSPGVEIAWRLAFSEWGKGLAFEAANEILRIGFHTLGLKEIFSFTTQANLRSKTLMERLGMKEFGTFDHPKLKDEHPLKRHSLYRLAR